MARLFDKIVGHNLVIDHFKKQIADQRVHHAFLMVGPSGIGRRVTAIAIAQALLCSKDSSACGYCSSCLRIETALVKKLSGTESVLFIEPEKAQIKVEQAHEVRSFLNLQAVSQARVVVIDSADKMNPMAANALLKLIEEPPPDTYFFLIAPTSEHVLPTIRSRSQIVTFHPLQMADLRKKLPQSPEWALRLCQGSLEKLGQLQEKDFIEARSLAISWLEDWVILDQAYLFDGYREFVKDRSQAKTLVILLLSFMRDLIYMHLNESDKILNLDLRSRLEPLLTKIDKNQVLRSSEKLLQMESAIDANLDLQLLFEKFWLETSPRGQGGGYAH